MMMTILIIITGIAGGWLWGGYLAFIQFLGLGGALLVINTAVINTAPLHDLMQILPFLA